MYPASSAFHQAVREGKPQKALLIFSDTVFTNDDIDVEQGIELTDVFNKEEDLSIGQALSNQLRFSLFNDERLLNNYSFGPFTATIGVQVSQSNYKQFGYVTVVSGGNTYYGSKTYPYLTRNGSTMPVSFRSCVAFCFCVFRIRRSASLRRLRSPASLSEKLS